MSEQTTDVVRHHVVMFSGGLGSWLTAKRVAAQHGTDRLTLLFADVGSDRSPHVGEDEDTYRFVREAAADVGGDLVIVSDGRDIWQVFKDDRFLGNSRLANCSKFLKQKPCRDWLTENRDPAMTTVYVGIDWTETHRLPAIEKGWAPYAVEAPMTVAPLLDRDAMQAECEAAGITLPRLYRAGFAHNNCGGFCVRAGQAQMELLLREHPERYAFHEAEEQALRDHLGKDVSVLNDRTLAGRLAGVGLSESEVDTYREPSYYDEENDELVPGTTYIVHRETQTVLDLPNRVPLTLRKYRENLADDPGLFDPFDVGGCGCFVAEEVPA